jgi:hypothetical protein
MVVVESGLCFVLRFKAHIYIYIFATRASHRHLVDSNDSSASLIWLKRYKISMLVFHLCVHPTGKKKCDFSL